MRGSYSCWTAALRSWLILFDISVRDQKVLRHGPSFAQTRFIERNRLEVAKKKESSACRSRCEHHGQDGQHIQKARMDKPDHRPELGGCVPNLAYQTL